MPLLSILLILPLIPCFFLNFFFLLVTLAQYDHWWYLHLSGCPQSMTSKKIC